MPSARLYVDGFNLYRRCLESKPHLKWLDLAALGRYLMPDYRIDHVHYFTAHLRPGLLVDPQSPVRQQMYLRALTAQPDVSVHLGTFRNDRRQMPVHPQTVDPTTGKWVTTAVRKLEEKGSDVNLGTRMTADAFTSAADVFVMLSNDSDLAGTLRMLKHEFGFRVGIIFPMPSSRSSKELVKTEPDFMAHITDEALAACQFPKQLRDGKGVFHCPPKWA
ncbi:NYN domain-containing protein [Herbiconiux sp. VKM Ac-2851]|uniref:NYN domain-containing protein n=1 Tax=Herbiconiux sp. VKM Ac-2851 TaxID=2739025 RepID=UPI001567C1A4|nr:NYN domain-containing protein [Herbiconiux sp. VKM Ac-2851]NQX33323.1 NYN domain-containing protein [Herbiconiux sp. VKM Ac-2851]